MCRGAAVTVLCAQILSFLAMMMQRCTKPEAHFAQHLAASVLPSLGIPADTATEFCRQLSSCVEDPRRMKKAFTVSVAVPAELWCRLPHVASRCGTNSISACDCASCDRARLRRRQGCDSKHERGRAVQNQDVVVVARSEQNRTEQNPRVAMAVVDSTAIGGLASLHHTSQRSCHVVESVIQDVAIRYARQLAQEGWRGRETVVLRRWCGSEWRQVGAQAAPRAAWHRVFFAFRHPDCPYPHRLGCPLARPRIDIGIVVA